MQQQTNINRAINDCVFVSYAKYSWSGQSFVSLTILQIASDFFACHSDPISFRVLISKKAFCQSAETKKLWKIGAAQEPRKIAQGNLLFFSFCICIFIWKLFNSLRLHNTNNPSIKWLSARHICMARSNPINQLIGKTEIKVLIYCRRGARRSPCQWNSRTLCKWNFFSLMLAYRLMEISWQSN